MLYSKLKIIAKTLKGIHEKQKAKKTENLKYKKIRKWKLKVILIYQ